MILWIPLRTLYTITFNSVFVSCIYPSYRWNSDKMMAKVDKRVNVLPVVKTKRQRILSTLYKSENKNINPYYLKWIWFKLLFNLILHISHFYIQIHQLIHKNCNGLCDLGKKIVYLISLIKCRYVFDQISDLNFVYKVLQECKYVSVWCIYQ